MMYLPRRRRAAILLAAPIAVVLAASITVAGLAAFSPAPALEAPAPLVQAASKASPKLFEACCTGKHIKEVIIELCHATGEQTKFMEYKLSDCMVSSVRPGGSSGGDGLPVEEVSFHYSKIEMKFTATDEKGKPKGDVSAKFDLIKNTV